jgi:phosphate transport system protein
MAKAEQDEALNAIKEKLLTMGVSAEGMVRDALRALTQQDVSLADDVIARDDAIDALDIEVETDCLKLMATRIADPAQRRMVGGALKIATDIERIADHAVDIAGVARRMSSEAIYKPLVDIPRLGDIARRMLRDALDAFVALDPALAGAVISSDDEADALYARMRRELASALQRDPESVIQASYLLFVAHYLERSCDHCINIAESVRFLATGHRRPPDDTNKQ